MAGVKWLLVFLLLWVLLLAAGYYLAVPISTTFLIVTTFLDAIPLLIVIYVISGIARRGVIRKVFAVVLILLLVGFIYQNPSYVTGTGPFKDLLSLQASYLTSLSSLLASRASSVQSATRSTGSGGSNTGVIKGGSSSSASSGGSQLANPLISNDAANVTYPSNYQALANFALGLIDKDRAASGLSPVTLSNVTSAQQHSDSMLYYDYFSHWDTQGYKPYMRYTLLGGTGAVAENIALDACTNSPGNATILSVVPCNTQTIEKGINNSNWGMMYNDASCCNNGHRANILNPLHNEVSIGIAYNRTNSALYFVEDFQNNYITLTSPIVSSGNQVEVQGSLVGAEDISTVGVYYDPLPQPMTASQLDKTSSYGPGTFVGGVFPPCGSSCPYFPGAVTVYATAWQVTSGSVSIDFPLANFMNTDGPGVYTIYVQTGNSTADSILMYSIFVS